MSEFPNSSLTPKRIHSAGLSSPLDFNPIRSLDTCSLLFFFYSTVYWWTLVLADFCRSLRHPSSEVDYRSNNALTQKRDDTEERKWHRQWDLKPHPHVKLGSAPVEKILNWNCQLRIKSEKWEKWKKKKEKKTCENTKQQLSFSCGNTFRFIDFFYSSFKCTFYNFFYFFLNLNILILIWPHKSLLYYFCQNIYNWPAGAQRQYCGRLWGGNISESRWLTILLALPLRLADGQALRPGTPGRQVGHGCGIMAGSFQPEPLQKQNNKSRGFNSETSLRLFKCS